MDFGNEQSLMNETERESLTRLEVHFTLTSLESPETCNCIQSLWKHQITYRMQILCERVSQYLCFEVPSGQPVFKTLPSTVDSLMYSQENPCFCASRSFHTVMFAGYFH